MSSDRTTVRLGDMKERVEEVQKVEGEARSIILTQAAAIDMLIRRGYVAYRTEAEQLGIWQKVLG